MRCRRVDRGMEVWSSKDALQVWRHVGIGGWRSGGSLQA